MNIPMNESVLKRFAVLNRRAALAHAYLFTGPADIGKGLAALAVAKFFNCEDPQEGRYFCDQCPACRKIQKGGHPDVHVTESLEGEPVKIEQIRGLLDQIRLRPFMAQKKIFIIHHAEDLTPEAANALLKTLEEPSTGSLLLLTTSVPQKILETVKSRCHVIRFSSISRTGLEAALARQGQGNDPDVHFLSFLAEGCWGRARQLKEDKMGHRKNEIIDKFILPSREKDFARKVLADKHKVKAFLDILLSWTRDCLLVKAGAKDQSLVHADRAREIRDFQRRYSFEDLACLNAEIVKTCRLFAENLNVKIPLLIIEEMLWAGS